MFVPVVSSTGKPLMPCHPARARELVRRGKAVRRFNRGLFYIKLIDREDGGIQPIAVGIDPGGKKEGLTVKSDAHTLPVAVSRRPPRHDGSGSCDYAVGLPSSTP